MRYGRGCANELGRLARVDATAARAALVAALLAPTWDGQCGEEAGFAEALARAAVTGWQTMTDDACDAADGDADWQTL